MIIYENEKYLTTDEASKFLGKTTSSFRQFMARNAIPRRKLGGRLFFPLKQLDGWFAKRAGYPAFESTGLSFDQVYTIEQLGKVFLTTKTHIYHFLNTHKIKRFKDNYDRTLFDRAQIDNILNANLIFKGGDDL